MPAARSFTELRFWQRARQWPKDIFSQTQNAPFAPTYGLLCKSTTRPNP